MNKIFAMNGIGATNAGPSIAEDYLTIYNRGNRQAAISGGLATALNGAQRRAKLNEALPSLAILALYQWIPAGADGGVGYREIQQMYSSPYNYLNALPAIVARKRDLSFQSFWDFGDWAGIKVEVDLFPKIKDLLTAKLGMPPQQWWVKQLGAQTIGDLQPINNSSFFNTLSTAASAVSPYAAVATGALSFVKNLFGGTDFQWKHGLPETWAPVDSDWSGYKVNPLRGLDTSYNTGVQTGSNTTSIAPALNNQYPDYTGVTKTFDPSTGLWRGSDGNFYNASGQITDSQGTILSSSGGGFDLFGGGNNAQPGLQTASVSSNIWLTLGLVGAAAFLLLKRLK